jgi:hypothetical protein
MHVSVDPPATQGTITVTALAGKSAALAGNIPPNKTMMVTTIKTTFINLLAIMHLLGLLSNFIFLLLLEMPLPDLGSYPCPFIRESIFFLKL